MSSAKHTSRPGNGGVVAQKRKRPTHSQIPRAQKRQKQEEDLSDLVRRVADFDAKSLTNAPEHFTDLPLSKLTQDGLSSSHFKKLTTIQSRAIPIALRGSDILGAAKTGSGKTLAFLIPVLENLYRKRWAEYDGLGALILSPTRELAIQIFEVLRKVGRHHTFSAGLVIGGKSLQEEQTRLGRMNILVATPGRMLQHLDQNAELDVGNIQMLVLDEADRIMDMGFKDTVDAIVDHLPPQRQTLMFSATQTKKVSDLARLSLSEPEFVSVHETADTATPSKLQQNYVVTPLPEKYDTLWSFLRANVKKKILVFLSSGKQVRFIYEAFRHLQPGVPLLHLHGRQKQTARLDITTKFSASKHVCLFATDVAARGLDFPAVDWVVQVDCPEDADTYIHRVGRTARYEHEGRAVMFLDPSEEGGMLKALERKRVVLEKINVRQKKMQNTIKNQLQNMCFKDPELKYLGQKAFISYVRSVYVQKDKDIFDVRKLDLEEYAASLGLPGAPKVKFVKGEDAKARKNMPRQLRNLSSDDDEGDEEDAADGKKGNKKEVRTKYDRMFERRNQDVLAPHYAKLIEDEITSGGDGRANIIQMADADADDAFLSVKRRIEVDDDVPDHFGVPETVKTGVGATQSMAVNSRATSSQAADEESESDVESPDEAESTTSDTPAEVDHDTDHHQNHLSRSLALPSHRKIQLSSNPNDEPLIVDSNRRAKLLTSRKKLLKYKGHGSHVHFADDDESTPFTKEYYEREEEFAKRGPAQEQRLKFLEEEKERTRTADVKDREVARMKKREKKIKRKEREKMEVEDEDFDGGEGVGVQLAPYEGGEDVDDDQDRGAADEDSGTAAFKHGDRNRNHGSASDIFDPEVGRFETRRSKRREETDLSINTTELHEQSSRKKPNLKTKSSVSSRGIELDHDVVDGHAPQSLEDLEAMASGLLTRRR